MHCLPLPLPAPLPSSGPALLGLWDLLNSELCPEPPVGGPTAPLTCSGALVRDSPPGMPPGLHLQCQDDYPPSLGPPWSPLRNESIGPSRALGGPLTACRDLNQQRVAAWEPSVCEGASSRMGLSTQASRRAIANLPLWLGQAEVGMEVGPRGCQGGP